MAPSWFQLLIVLLLVVVLFGRGRISDMMGDLAKGIKSFKKGLSDEDQKADEPKPVDQQTPPRIESATLTREDAKVG
jgi:sec-independent protein translocase protein TatA